MQWLMEALHKNMFSVEREQAISQGGLTKHLEILSPRRFDTSASILLGDQAGAASGFCALAYGGGISAISPPPVHRITRFITTSIRS
jgi:hypothetical protein